MYLPRVEGKLESVPTAAPAAAAPGGDETILFVEDDRLIRELAIKALKRFGYRVLAAGNGEDALAIAARRDEPIDLLLTDVVMPGMNGRQLAQRLAETHPETRVLFTSGYTENAIAHHGVIDEELDFIGKPYTLHGLATAIRKALGSAPPPARG
jgi:DNA-binding NtrC family response regulator